MESFTTGKELFEETMIEGAKSSVIFSLVEVHRNNSPQITAVSLMIE